MWVTVTSGFHAVGEEERMEGEWLIWIMLLRSRVAPGAEKCGNSQRKCGGKRVFT